MSNEIRFVSFMDINSLREFEKYTNGDINADVLMKIGTLFMNKCSNRDSESFFSFITTITWFLVSVLKSSEMSNEQIREFIEEFIIKIPAVSQELKDKYKEEVQENLNKSSAVSH